ncbi:tannase and feruloyl esterase-domain-containing protein [Exophiala viscosa]|uniref:tannase and feruloyl esterase-domain-containing protein n=1 Tax=Exophiala viscosa TaxID=2486360 RepID=UPI00218EA2D1|nr:tannase and feruloyl esterase-domain-containing protein [Exophiala viscosa]
MGVLQGQAPIVIASTTTNLTAQCLSSSLPAPDLFGAEILSVTSSLVPDYTASFLPPSFFNSDPPLYGKTTNLSFCNVSVAYTHPGQNDTINVSTWLPISASDSTTSTSTDPPTTSPSWNGLFLSFGGGGWRTCLPVEYISSPLTQGYAVSRTDGGHDPDSEVDSWALNSPGNVNLYLLQDFASVALHDMAVIGKSIVQSFYGRPPRHFYFQGCSTGGRQGLMHAQRYPNDYDGILAAAPAIYWPKLLVSHHWPHVVMAELKAYPHPCELDAITAAAIKECDHLDGVTDGVISTPSLCTFDPSSMIGRAVPCTETSTGTLTITHAAAQVASAIWRGPVDTHNNSLWHGFSQSTPLSALAQTKCHKNGTCTSASTSSTTLDWIRLFLYKDPTLTPDELVQRIDRSEFTRLFHQSDQLYRSIIATDDVDLSDFAAHGGKMITWHGMTDEAIMPGQTQTYYEKVLAHAATETHDNVSVADYYRLFLAPGVDHCGGGTGALPINVMAKLRAWVEDGVPPETLDAESFSRPGGDKIRRPLCMYPLVARYKGHGDARKAENYECADSF